MTSSFPLPPPCEALLFDLDGTLIDSRRDIAEALNASLALIHRNPLSLDAILPMIGDGARALVARALAFENARGGGGGGDDEGPADVALLDRTQAIFQTAYAERPCVHTTLMPGAVEAIALDVPRAIITNKPRVLTMLVLEGLGIAHAFRAVRAGGDGPMKPSPDGVIALAKELGIARERLDRVWLVGDGPQDVLAGRAAGAFTIAVPGIADREAVLSKNPDRVVTSLHDVVELFAASVTSA